MLNPKHVCSLLLVGIMLLCFHRVGAQDSSRLDRLIALPDKLFASLDKKSRTIEGQLSKQTDKYLHKLEKQERRLQKKLWRKDSTLAKELFVDIEGKYAQLRQAPKQVGKYSGVYSGHLDSLSIALNFLKASNLAASPELEKTLAGFKGLQDRLNHTDQVKKYIVDRQRLLKEQFERLGMVRELKQFRKEVYYYQAQVREIKQLYDDPSKLEAKLMQALTKVPAFKDFFAQNSQLGSLFALPGSNAGSTASLQGLQTRASVQQAIQQRFGSGPDVTAALRRNVQAAQGQLNQLKDAASKYSNGSFGNTSSDMDVPDFKVNPERVKSFKDRLELGANIQSQRSRSVFPVRSDIGVSVGYRLSDKSVVGVGLSGVIGWGSGFDDMEITYQGVGGRTYLDLKLKGSLYVSGGFELNYRSLIHSLDQLKDYSALQKSGLIGVSKRYGVSKKLKGEVKLLWDFLSYQQVPRISQPILFRVGYSLK